MAVIFIPGIKGSELVDTYAPDWPSRWTRPVADPMALALDGGMDHWLQPTRLLDEAYGPIMHKLRAWLAPEPVYAFSYDWRQRLEVSAKRLVAMLEEVCEREHQAGRSPQLKFVTHSMGGLLLRSALTLRNRREPLSGIERVAFIAPPFRGSIGATYALVVGETDAWFGTDRSERRIVRGFPSVYQMTPSWPGAAVNEHGRGVDLFNPDNWQANVAGGETFQPTFLRDAGAFARGRKTHRGGHSNAPMVPDAALAKAADKVLVICGSGQPTPCALPVLTKNRPNPNWFDFAHADVDTRGDGRVWLPSAAIKGVRLAAFDNIGEHALTCRDPRVASLTSLWLQGHGALMLKPRTASDPVKRRRRYFPVFDGDIDSLGKHIA
ncbi:MAG TPA: hypothetical protein VFJ15_00890 [Oleiagrimonas sp.]|nr:hypothetical protein [Oleiagrimonas sp.]